MQAHEFAYWLQGFAEMTDAPPTEAQWVMIKDHLNLVLHKKTAPLGGWQDKVVYPEEKVQPVPAVAPQKSIGEIIKEGMEKRKEVEKNNPWSPFEHFPHINPDLVPMTPNYPGLPGLPYRYGQLDITC